MCSGKTSSTVPRVRAAIPVEEEGAGSLEMRPSRPILSGGGRFFRRGSTRHFWLPSTRLHRLWWALANIRWDKPLFGWVAMVERVGGLSVKNNHDNKEDDSNDKVKECRWDLFLHDLSPSPIQPSIYWMADKGKDLMKEGMCYECPLGPSSIRSLRVRIKPHIPID